MPRINKKNDPNYQRIGCSIPKNLHTKLKVHIARQGTYLNEEITEAVGLLLDKYEGNLVKSTATGNFIFSILESKKPEEKTIKKAALELGIEEEKLQRLITLLFGEENPDIIE